MPGELLHMYIQTLQHPCEISTITIPNSQSLNLELKFRLHQYRMEWTRIRRNELSFGILQSKCFTFFENKIQTPFSLDINDKIKHKNISKY